MLCGFFRRRVRQVARRPGTFAHLRCLGFYLPGVDGGTKGVLRLLRSTSARWVAYTAAANTLYTRENNIRLDLYSRKPKNNRLYSKDSPKLPGGGGLDVDATSRSSIALSFFDAICQNRTGRTAYTAFLSGFLSKLVIPGCMHLI